MTKILFVCLGNICRSPMAEGMFRHIAQNQGHSENLEIGSAGTGAWHIGTPPDERAQAAMMGRGIDISGLRGAQVSRADFDHYDLILAMDKENFHNLNRLAPEGQSHKIKMFLDYAPEIGTREVPDPYFGHAQGFDHVLDLVEAAAQGLLKEIS